MAWTGSHDNGGVNTGQRVVNTGQHPVMERSSTPPLSVLAAGAVEQILDVFGRAEALGDDPLRSILDEIVRARRGKILLYGVGREGLMVKALAMRLAHLGLDAHCVGDMATPPIASGDLFIASAGPGSFATVDALVALANAAGARVALLTAQPGHVKAPADVVAVLPARTMADSDDVADRDWALPMGSVYEGALFVLFELLVLKLRDELGESGESMRARHTNME